MTRGDCQRVLARSLRYSPPRTGTFETAVRAVVGAGRRSAACGPHRGRASEKPKADVNGEDAACGRGDQEFDRGAGCGLERTEGRRSIARKRVTDRCRQRRRDRMAGHTVDLARVPVLRETAEPARGLDLVPDTRSVQRRLEVAQPCDGFCPHTVGFNLPKVHRPVQAHDGQVRISPSHPPGIEEAHLHGLGTERGDVFEDVRVEHGVCLGSGFRREGVFHLDAAEARADGHVGTGRSTAGEPPAGDRTRQRILGIARRERRRHVKDQVLHSAILRGRRPHQGTDTACGARTVQPEFVTDPRTNLRVDFGSGSRPVKRESPPQASVMPGETSATMQA